MTKSTHSKAWLGYLFLLYALFCISLPFFLIQWWPTQLPTPAEKEIHTPQPEPKTKPPVNIQKMKQAFYDKLIPAIKSENQKVTNYRERLLALQSSTIELNNELTPQQQAFLHTLAIQYRVPDVMNDRALAAELLVRVDEVPVSLVLAQAAIESAWGRSRFAQEANNYFGQWCFTKGCGVIPKRRNPGASHEVAKFDSLEQAVAAYLRNINSHVAYGDVRQLRENARLQQRLPDSLEMAQGLVNYSARGEKYIHELQQLIEYNQLKQFDSPPPTQADSTK